VAQAIIRELARGGYDVIGYPRLVRLNPNIPWKTRGNGAVSIQFGKGIGKKTRIGDIDNKNISCYAKGSFKDYDVKKIEKIVEKVLEKYIRLDDPKTNPGFVILSKKPSFSVYDKTVKEIVSLKDTKILLKSLGAFYKGYKNGRGLIGATASIAWSPIRDKTYELIAYREEEKWGTERFVDDDSVKKMDKKHPSTFDNYDYKNKHNRLVPSSPCPVLYGIRGDKANDLILASSMIKSERVDRWLIFESNQGTDDHLQKKAISKIQPYQSVVAKGDVCKSPYTIKGGHVFFKIKDLSGSIDCAAYEPTKQFRNIVRNLTVGDAVEVYGGVREKPLTVNLEKLKVNRLKKQNKKVENPVCIICGKHMKSKGTGQGYKCIKCGIKSGKPLFKEFKRKVNLGFYEVPICARRHLSKPLKRMKP